MLSAKRASYRIALTAIFATTYFILGTIPVFPLATGGFLRANKVLAPLTGMVLGPGLAGASMVLGSFMTVAFSGQPPILPLGPLPLDFVPDATVAIVSGLTFVGKAKAALGVPLLMIISYFIDPISVAFVPVGGMEVPFAWLHILSVLVLAAAFFLHRQRQISRRGVAFIAAIAFASLLSGQLAGTIVGQNVSVRFGTLALSAWQGKVETWPWGFFYTYPIERIIYAAASVLVAVPVLRAITRRIEGAIVSE